MNGPHSAEIRRSWFLALAAWTANVYVFGYASDATLSVLDDAIHIAFGGSSLAGIRNAIAIAVLLATLPMLLLTIFVPHLPRAALVPMIAFLFWTEFGAPPFNGAPSGSATLLGLSAAQLLLAANAFRIIRRRAGGQWHLSAARFPVIRHLWLRTAGAFVLSAALGAVALVGLAMAAVVTYIQSTTGGYMQFGWTAIEMRETTLARGGTKVHLVATAHIGEPRFYRTLRASIPDDALVFVEGVTDRNNRLQGFSQQPAARALGLATQDIFNELLPAADDGEDDGADLETAAAESGNPQGEPHVIRADLDASAFSDHAIEYLHDIDAISRSPTFAEAVANWERVNRKYSNRQVTGVFDEIIGQRNRHLLEAFDTQAKDYRTVVIPWGAMHMPGLEKGLTARRFHVISTRSILLAHYSTILRKLMTGEKSHEG